MKKFTVLFLLATVTIGFISTGCNQKEPTDPRNEKFHQEILPKGRNSDKDTISTLTIGQHDSISNPK